MYAICFIRTICGIFLAHTKHQVFCRQLIFRLSYIIHSNRK